MEAAQDGSPALKAAREAFLKARRADSAKRKTARGASKPGNVSRHAQGDASNTRETPSVIPSDKPDSATPRRADGRISRDLRPDYGTSPPESLRGRPVTWTPDLAAQWQMAALVWLSEGKSLSAFVRQHPNGPSRWTFLQWLDENPSFASSYVRARAAGADAMADRLIETAEGVQDAGPQDSARVNAARLMADSLKWTASKLKPGAYADRLEHGGTVQIEAPAITDDNRAMALAAFIARQAVSMAHDLPDAMRRLQTSGNVLELTAAQPSPTAAQPSPTVQPGQDIADNQEKTGPLSQRRGEGGKDE